MEVKKGITGRCVCGTFEAVFGVVLLLVVIICSLDDAVDMRGHLCALFLIKTGIFGIVSEDIIMIIGYMVDGIICTLGFGLHTIGCIKILTRIEDYAHYFDSYGHEDEKAFLVTMIFALILIAVAFMVSVFGVIFACLPLCARNHEQDTFQFQRFNEPEGAIGPPIDYNYSNTGYVHTAQTQQNNYDNKSVGGSGAPPNYNNDSNAISVDTKQGLA